MSFQHLEIEVVDGAGWVWINRPEKKNAFSPDIWEDIPVALDQLAADESTRVIVLAARGDAFTVGIDVSMLAEFTPTGGSLATQNRQIYNMVKRLQATATAFADCPKPIIAAVHGYCIGAGIDLITACDIRLAADDAVFSVRETRLGIVADVGTLQRLPKLIPPGHAAELIYTGRDIGADEAERIGLVNRVLPDAEVLHAAAAELAAEIAANSPLAVEGAKAVLAAGAELTTEQALDYVALWNSAFIRSNDLTEALTAFSEKRPPHFRGS